MTSATVSPPASGTQNLARPSLEGGVDWELYEAGPETARHRVLLLPGGLTSARFYADVMAEPALSDVRLIAATLPGQCGTPPPSDVSIENYARLAGELARERRCDVVVGSSIGATVALEMVLSRVFVGPVVLLEISLSKADEARFLRAIVGLGSVLGAVPAAALIRMVGMMARGVSIPAQRKEELARDLRRNQPRVIKRVLRDYLRYLGRDADPAARLCEAAVPTWVVHSEHGDGGLTKEEHRSLEACPHAVVITLPGSSMLLTNERPQQIAEIIGAAVAAT